MFLVEIAVAMAPATEQQVWSSGHSCPHLGLMSRHCAEGLERRRLSHQGTCDCLGLTGRRSNYQLLLVTPLEKGKKRSGRGRWNKAARYGLGSVVPVCLSAMQESGLEFQAPGSA